MNKSSESDPDHRLEDWLPGEPPVEDLAEQQGPDDAAGDDPSADDDALIERFRGWLREARAEAEELAEDEESSESERDDSDVGEDDESGLASSLSQGAAAGCEHEGVGIYRLVEELTALRQEVKLQARGARGLEEEVASFLPRLRETLDAAQSVEQRAAGSLEAATRTLGQVQQAASSSSGSVAPAQFQALALAIAELDDALDRGRRQLERSSEQLLADSSESLIARLEESFARQSALARWSGQAFYEEVRELIQRDAGNEQRQVLHAALVDGYGLIQQRLLRLMAKEDITRLVTVGQEVDPEQMVVVEAVAADESTDHRGGIVVEEIRRGYLWRGRVLRFAEVKATRAGNAAGTW